MLKRVSNKIGVVYNNIYHHLIFIVFAVLVIGLSIDFKFTTNFINGMDSFQSLNTDYYLKRSLFVWNPDFAGKHNPMPFEPFVYNLILKIINNITDNIILSVNIYYVLFVYFLLISYFLFYNMFVSKGDALLATFLSVLNISVITTLYAPQVSVNIALVSFPLMCYLMHSYVSKKKFIYAFLYALYQIVLFRVLNMLIITNILVPVFVYLIFKDQIKTFSLYVKKVVFLWFIELMFCLAMVINLGFSYKGVLGNDRIQKYNETSMSKFYKDRDSLSNIFRLTNHFSLAEDKPEFPGFVYFKFSNLYIKSWFYILISFLFFGLVFLNFFRSNDKKYVVLMFFLLLLIFFAKSINPPVAVINNWLYSFSIFTTFFRSGSKYFMYLIIPIAVLMIFLNDRKEKFFYPVISLYILSHGFLIFIYAKPVGLYWNTVLPDTYFETAGKLDSLQDSGKFLLLPYQPRFAGEIYYEDGYAGVTRLRSLSRKSFISKASSLGSSNEYNNMYEKLFDEGDINYESLNTLFNIMNYRYVLIEKDTVYYQKQDFTSAKNVSSQIEDEMDTDIWEKIFSNDQSVLYKVKDNLFKGKIYSNNSSVFYTIISPVKYKLYIPKLSDISEITFLEAYNDGWEVYLTGNQVQDFNCSGVYFSESNSKECVSTNYSFDPTDIRYLYHKHLLDGNHYLSNYYANGWVIDTDYIKESFPMDAYTLNDDGSIGIELVIYFKPQSYFILGLMLSTFTILVCFLYSLYDLKFCHRQNVKSL